jgi:P27 family predicted phage terminase small subunit
MPRIPQSAAARALRGNPRRKTKVEGVVPCSAPVMPSWLPPAAKCEWKRIVPHLKSASLLSSIDFGVVVAYVVAVAEIETCTEMIAKEGMMVECRGQRYPHPILKTRAAAQQRVKALASELGLTAMSRKRGHVETVDANQPVDPMDRYFRPPSNIPSRNRKQPVPAVLQGFKLPG